MLVNVVPVSSLDSFNYFIYPQQDVSNQQYFQNQVQNLSQNLSNFGNQFMATSKQIYDKINDTEAIRIAKAALRFAKGMLMHPNEIVALTSLEELRTAQPIMQRYMMALPVIRQLYMEQRVDAYSDTYYDICPNEIGENHYDYRRVMDGMIVDSTNPDINEYEWIATQYYHEPINDESDLTFTQKCLILDAWSIIEMFTKTGDEDPTNMFGGKIG